MDNRVYWITGLSGAGKTTIGMALYYRLKATADNVVILDGDALKEALDSQGGYSGETRRRRAFQYARLCRLLADQGITVICCTIAMFDDVREWNRKNIDNYIEVFLDVPREVLISRDSKGLYSRFKSGIERDVAGFDVDAELPKSPDIALRNDGALTVDQCVNDILTLGITAQTPIAQDYRYWNEYYRQRLAEDSPSPFAQYVAPRVKSGDSLIDLGCGNGRDALYFHRHGAKVTAIDQSPAAIAIIKAQEPLGVACVCGDIVKVGSLLRAPASYDHCYSRFSLHALSDEQQQSLIGGVYGVLKPGGRFWIEARGVRDALYGRGEPAGRHGFFYGGHYRRFIVMDELVDNLKRQGFTVEYAQEAAGFAPYKGEDPVAIRVAAVKRDT